MRTFVAIDFDDVIKRRLNVLQERLRRRLPDLRWVDTDRMHLTLKFLGEIGEQQALSTSTALSELAVNLQPFDISVEELGTFGTGKVLWVGVRDIDGHLAQCHAKCEELLFPLGFENENRPFRPHLTLARNRSPKHAAKIREAIERESKFTAGTQHVSSLTFYQSTLTKRGPIYAVLSRHRFSEIE